LNVRPVEGSNYTDVTAGASDNCFGKGWLIVNSLLMPIILFATVVASVSFGIFAAYAAVICILHTFGPASQPEPARPRLVLVPSQNHASGD
jgi:membrane protein required for beta-lactamase induction